jgi:hypothetical protein
MRPRAEVVKGIAHFLDLFENDRDTLLDCLYGGLVSSQTIVIPSGFDHSLLPCPVRYMEAEDEEELNLREPEVHDFNAPLQEPELDCVIYVPTAPVRVVIDLTVEDDEEPAKKGKRQRRTSRMSTGGVAPHKALASKAAGKFRPY